jgi:hypothetical protein
MYPHRNRLGQFRPKWYNQYDFKKAFILAGVIVVIVCALIGYVQYRYEQEINNAFELQNQMYMDGYEAGHFDGLTEGDKNGRNATNDEFYKSLSKNPTVSFLFKKYFPEPDVAKTMRAISLSESKGKQVQHFKLNRNGSWDCGFFQTNTIHRNKGETMEMFCERMNGDLEANFEMARKIYDERKQMFGDGFTAWSDYNNGKYLKYIK